MSSPVRENRRLAPCSRDELDADAVPFPFGAKSGVELGEVASSSGWASISGRKRGAARARARARGRRARRTASHRAASRPCQTSSISSIGLAASFGERGLGEPRGDADAQRAGDQLHQRPAPGGVERVEPARDAGAGISALRRARGASRPPRRGRAAAPRAARLGPDQRDGLGEVADIVVADSANRTGSTRAATRSRISAGLASEARARR